VILVTICPSGCHEGPSFTSREGYALLCPGERVRTKLWAICPCDSPPQMRMTGNEGSTTCLSIARGSGLQNNTYTVSKLGVVDSMKDKKGTLALDCGARLSFWAVFRARITSDPSTSRVHSQMCVCSVQVQEQGGRHRFSLRKWRSAEAAPNRPL
jgi:hypothetical protein